MNSREQKYSDIILKSLETKLEHVWRISRAVIFDG